MQIENCGKNYLSVEYRNTNLKKMAKQAIISKERGEKMAKRGLKSRIINFLRPTFLRRSY